MKKIFVLLVMFVALQGNAQTNCFKTTTLIEGSSFKQFSFIEKISWRRRLNRDSQPKTVYNFSSIYKLDSIWGIGLYGLDIDLMSEKFEKKSGNNFRYQNKMRLGFVVMLEKNIYYKAPYDFIYPNAELYLSYLHLPHKARGDRNTKTRKGSVMIFGSITPTRRISTYIKFKPFGKAWIGLSFKQRFPIPKIGLFAEIELNKRGYDKTKTESSKDLYRGFTIFGGPDYDIKGQSYSFFLGIKYEGRNH
ncbi:MAG: hypothetical protein WA101_03270 [Minisyncoccia bacterium]